MKKQTKYFIIGLLFLISAMFSITLFPIFIKLFTKFSIQKYIFIQIEFFLLVASSIFYLFSPKYYKYQLLTILLAIISYKCFAMNYNLIYNSLLTFVTKPL